MPLGERFCCAKGDVFEGEDCRNIAQQTVDKWRKINTLSNTAGTTKFVGAMI